MSSASISTTTQSPKSKKTEEYTYESRSLLDGQYRIFIVIDLAPLRLGSNRENLSLVELHVQELHFFARFHR